MFIKAVFISNSTKRKILVKHNISIEEISNILLNNQPIFKKTREVYLAIGRKNRCLTIIFVYNKANKDAKIITAYPSSKWQIKLYKKMKK